MSKRTPVVAIAPLRSLGLALAVFGVVGGGGDNLDNGAAAAGRRHSCIVVRCWRVGENRLAVDSGTGGSDQKGEHNGSPGVSLVCPILIGGSRNQLNICHRSRDPRS